MKANMPEGVICLICTSLADPLCDCGNVGILIDRDNTINIYVEDIRTVRLSTEYRKHRNLQQPFTDSTFIKYYDVRNTPINFIEINDTAQTSKSPYDEKLMAVLDKYTTVIAANKRIGSTRKAPNKRNMKEKV
jgi:hypothetical protein